MKLHSYLARSRHGIYYFRLTYWQAFARKEVRWSLKTRDPTAARMKAVHLSSVLARKRMGNTYDPAKFNPHDPATWPVPERVGAMDADVLRHLEVVFERPDGLKAIANADPNNPADVQAMLAWTEKMLQDPQVRSMLESRQPRSTNAADGARGGEPAPTAPEAPGAVNQAGTTVVEMIQRFATRKRKTLASKSLYEYGKIQAKFSDWLCVRKAAKQVAIRSVTHDDLAAFIDDLQEEGLDPRTIQQKYLAAVSGLFVLAQSTGAFPKGQQLPSRGHGLMSKKALDKASAVNGWRLFEGEELTKIFAPENLCAAEKPCDYWLPLLGLFTGGRISELCQLRCADIRQIDGIWALDIDENDGSQTVKTTAGIRKIPLHPTLIELGFLDYLEVARRYGGTIFPYMNPDQFGHYSGTPSERFGRYLNRLGIKDRRKVFHSLRSNSNDCLKQQDVPEETRCQFLGHEHKTVNSERYSKKHSLQYLLKNVASKLVYPTIDFQGLKQERGRFDQKLEGLMAEATKFRARREVRKKRAVERDVEG
jgi:integrase